MTRIVQRLLYDCCVSALWVVMSGTPHKIYLTCLAWPYFTNPLYIWLVIFVSFHMWILVINCSATVDFLHFIFYLHIDSSWLLVISLCLSYHLTIKSYCFAFLKAETDVLTSVPLPGTHSTGCNEERQPKQSPDNFNAWLKLSSVATRVLATLSMALQVKMNPSHITDRVRLQPIWVLPLNVNAASIVSFLHGATCCLFTGRRVSRRAPFLCVNWSLTQHFHILGANTGYLHT